MDTYKRLELNKDLNLIKLGIKSSIYNQFYMNKLNELNKYNIQIHILNFNIYFYIKIQ